MLAFPANLCYTLRVMCIFVVFGVVFIDHQGSVKKQRLYLLSLQSEHILFSFVVF